MGGTATALAARADSTVPNLGASSEGQALNVMAYGAKGDGKTDDTQSILRTIAAANRGSLRAVYFPAGTFVVSETIVLDAPITIRGAGCNVSILVTSKPTGDVIFAKSPGVHISALGFQNQVARAADAYVKFSNLACQCSLTYFEMTGAFVGVWMEAAYALWIEYGNIRDGSVGPGSAAIVVNGGNDQYIRCVTVDNPAERQPSAGISILNTGCINITDCDIIHSTNDLYITGGYDIYAINSYFDTAVNGIVIEPKTPVTRCHFIGCWTGSHSQCGVIIHASVGNLVPVGDIDFIGHHCFLNGQDGFRVEQATNIQIANSGLAQNQGAGLVLGACASGCRITNNMIGNTAILNGNTTGIVIDSAANQNFITGNRIVGNLKEQISGAGIKNVVQTNMGVDV